jgi:hypothetical protein
VGPTSSQETLAEKKKEHAWYQRRLEDALAVLADSLVLIHQGKMQFIPVIAGQLRMLLCDTTRNHDKVVDVSLLKRLLPDLRLGALNAYDDFESSAQSMPLRDWLTQTVRLNSKVVTILQLIRQVSDERGGVHADYQKSRDADGNTEAAWMKRIAEHLIQRLKTSSP